MIYDINQTQLNSAYSISGSSLSTAYDISGNVVYTETPPTPVINPMDYSNMPSNYRTNIESCLSAIDTYLTDHDSAYAIAQFNDTHQVFNQNEPNFLEYYRTFGFSRMLFLGDQVDDYNQTKYTDALSYIRQSEITPKVVVMGNHEYGLNYVESTPNPTAYYQTAMSGMDNEYWYEDDAHGLIYYTDDIENNVRYIILDYYWTGKSQGSTDLDADQLEWLASVLEDTTDMDIIICAHSPINPFILVDTGEEKSSSAVITNVNALKGVINAFIDRSTYTASTTHDYSSCTGDFIMYTCGHYHKPGYKSSSYDFNMFTGPAMTTYASIRGITFFIIDPDSKKIKWLIAYHDSAGIDNLEFTY